MKLNSYHRAIVGYLADSYGVEDAKIAPSDSRNTHPVLSFTYAGEPRRMQVHSSGGTHNRDPLNLLAIKKQDIRRMLGPMPPIPDSIVGVMQTMDRFNRDQPEEIKIMEPSQELPAMEAKPFNPLPLPTAVATQATEDWKVAVALYRINATRGSLRLFLPRDLVDAWGQSMGYSVEQLGDEDWRLSKSSIYTRLSLKPYENGQFVVQVAIEAGRLFGRSPAEAWIVGDSLMIHAPLADRRWVTQDEKFIHNSTPSAAWDAHEGTKEATPPTFRGVIGATVTAEQMRSCLEEIRRIERSCPYRIMRAKDGDVVFDAPRIE